MSLADGDDPRPDLRARGLLDEPEPLVAGPPQRANTLMIVGLFAVAAVALFLVLNAQRVRRQELARPAPVRTAAATPPPALEMPQPLPRPVNPALFPEPQPMAPASNMAVLPAAAGAAPVAGVAPPIDPQARLRAPSVVVDLQSASRPALAVAGEGAAANAPATGGTAVALPRNPTLPAVLAAGLGATAATAGTNGAAGQNPNQVALDQLARAAEPAPDVAVASQLHDLGAVITQGAVIPAVLETAISSDLPGYARAVVSRDVLSFDGRQVLIPRSSRLIGEYRSAISLGQSRVFVIWTRVIRPDGVSVQIGSPGADALGRGGLQGEVDRHFFTRFGGSIVLSVLNAGVAAVSRTPSTQITIGSPAAAAAAASSASFAPTDLAPTIKIAQGEAIRIFVSRDLDFSAVKPAR